MSSIRSAAGTFKWRARITVKTVSFVQWENSPIFEWLNIARNIRPSRNFSSSAFGDFAAILQTYIAAGCVVRSE
jgi:hypothetical protein